MIVAHSAPWGWKSGARDGAPQVAIRITVAAGQTGYMLAGQELPIQTANFINNVLQSSTTYKPSSSQRSRNRGSFG